MAKYFCGEYVLHVYSRSAREDKKTKEWIPSYGFTISQVFNQGPLSHTQIVKSEEKFESLEECLSLARKYINEYLDNAYEEHKKYNEL